MKKYISVFILSAFLFVAGFPMTFYASSAKASFIGPGTVRAGDTITVSFQLNGNGVYGLSGTLSYDESQVTLSKVEAKIASPWVVEFADNDFVIYDNNLSTPINGNITLFTATFTVKNLPSGTTVNISCVNVMASDTIADIKIGEVTYTATIAEPLSGNNDLKSLTIGNTTITPSFSAGVTNYAVSVPYEISKLDITAVAADEKAKVEVTSPNLAVNDITKVTIKVTAENGAIKTYIISVKRAQDPNYTPSDNNKLSEITIDGFMISPRFSKDVEEYVVWLPYEIDTIKVRGVSEDNRASVEVVGGTELLAGEDNIVKVICIAENGDKREYTIIAKRATEHGMQTTPPDGSEPDEIETEEDLPSGSEPNDFNVKTKIDWWWLIVTASLSLIMGSAIGFFGKDYIKKK